MCNLCTNNDVRYLEIAAQEAEKSNLGFRHGCIAVSGGKIIARGYNNARTFSKDGLINNTCSCHAEIDVLRKYNKIKKKYKKFNLYVARMSNDNFRCSSPCEDCYRKMLNFPIKFLIYSDSQEQIVKKPFNSFHPNFATSGNRAIQEMRVIPYVSSRKLFI